MTRYKEAVKEMLDQNKDLFASFRIIHDKYAQDQEKWQDEFNLTGREVSDVLRKYENKLCGKSERGVYGKFSSTLAEKFRSEIKNHFPKIDYIGVRIS